MMWDLFLNRLKKDWNYQTDILRNLIDWTIVVYLILPMLFFGGVFYRSLWVTSPDWFDSINWIGWIIFLFVLSITKKWRTYLYEADSVFLSKRPDWVTGMLKVSFFYNTAASFLFSFVTIFLFLPYLIGILHISVGQCVLLMFLLALLRSFCKVSLYYISMRYSGFNYFFVALSLVVVMVLFSAIAITGVVYVPLAIIFFAVALFLLTRFVFVRTLLNQSWLNYHGAQEAKWKVRLIRMIFIVAKEIETPPSSKMAKRPKLFRKSKRIIRSMNPTAGMLELFLKHHLRHPKYLFHYFQLLGITIISVLLVPVLWLFIAIAAILCLVCVTIHWTMWAPLIDKHAIGVKYRFHRGYVKAKNWTLIGMMSPILFIAIVFLIR